MLGEAPAMESAQLPSGHPAIRSSGHFHAGSLDDPMTRWPDGRMTIGRSHQAGITRSNASAFRRTNGTMAERGFMLATKARAMLGEAPATESAQLPSGHPAIRPFPCRKPRRSDDPMARWSDDDWQFAPGRHHEKQCQRLQANKEHNGRTRLHFVFLNKFSTQGGTMEKLEYREMMVQRTVMFTVNLDKMLRNLPTCMAKKKLQDQLGRSGSSIGANFAESGPAESRKDFIHKLSIALKEAEETSFWLRCVIAEFPENKDAVELWNECHEFIKILQASVSTARANENHLATGTK